METRTLEASQSEALITDEEFDLMLGELELESPDNGPNPLTCFTNHIYCTL